MPQGSPHEEQPPKIGVTVARDGTLDTPPPFVLGITRRGAVAYYGSSEFLGAQERGGEMILRVEGKPPK